MQRAFVATAVCLVLLAFVGCAAGPKYARPSVPAPPSWSVEAPWRESAPKDSIPKGSWWTIFNDPQLNEYEQTALRGNQNIQEAVQRLEQARALAKISQSELFPSLNAGAAAQRQRISGNRPVVSPNVTTTEITQNSFSIPFTVSYEADLFGRIRRNIEASRAQYQGSAADLESVRLLVTSELAADYFSLRALDGELDVVEQAIRYEQRGLDLVNQRHRGGIASGLEVAQQESVLDANKAQLSLLRRDRAQFEHAIAVLISAPAPQFNIAKAPFQAVPPGFAIGLPSDLLERRPDIASAEREVARTNALIGVEKAGFFPSLLLAAGGGLQSRDISTLFNAPSAIWSVGAAVSQTVFSGGRVHAQVDFAKAGNQASVAAYRQTVLQAFQQVEDGLTGLDTLSNAAHLQQQAIADSERSLTIANNRYVGGLTSYLDVITAQETLLANRRLATQILGQRLITSVSLVKALGGGWTRAEIDALNVNPSLKQAFVQ